MWNLIIDFFKNISCHVFNARFARNRTPGKAGQKEPPHVTRRKSSHRHRQRPGPRPGLRPGARPPGRGRRRQRCRRRRRRRRRSRTITAAGGRAVAVVAPVGTTEAAQQLVQRRRRGLRPAGHPGHQRRRAAGQVPAEDDGRGLRPRHQRPPARHLHLRPRGLRLLQGERRSPAASSPSAPRPASAATSARPTTPPRRPASWAWSAPGRWR